jgi:putative transposase
MSNPFRYFNSSPEVIRLVVMMYVRYPLSLCNVEDLLAERGIDISHETIRCHSAHKAKQPSRRLPRTGAAGR